MRLYLAGPMFTAADSAYNLALAARLRQWGFDVFCPNEDEPINDKTRSDVTARMIYGVDIGALEACNVVVCQVSEDSGTNWEAGYMDCLAKRVDSKRYYGVVGLATDMRLRTQPDLAKPGVENQAGYVNALVAGGLQQSLGVFLDEAELVERLLAVRREREGT